MNIKLALKLPSKNSSTSAWLKHWDHFCCIYFLGKEKKQSNTYYPSPAFFHTKRQPVDPFVNFHLFSFWLYRLHRLHPVVRLHLEGDLEWSVGLHDVSWWLNQPIWKNMLKLDHSPRIRVKIQNNTKYLKSPTHRLILQCFSRRCLSHVVQVQVCCISHSQQPGHWDIVSTRATVTSNCSFQISWTIWGGCRGGINWYGISGTVGRIDFSRFAIFCAEFMKGSRMKWIYVTVSVFMYTTWHPVDFRHSREYQESHESSRISLPLWWLEVW